MSHQNENRPKDKEDVIHADSPGSIVGGRGGGEGISQCSSNSSEGFETAKVEDRLKGLKILIPRRVPTGGTPGGKTGPGSPPDTSAEAIAHSGDDSASHSKDSP